MEDNDMHPARVLVVMAHPDDPEFSAGGTIARWAAAGSQVHYVIITDGSRGSSDPQMTSERLAAIRRAEQNQAAAILGAKGVTFLNYTDGLLYNTPELRRDLARHIRIHRPEVVITHDPRARIIGDKRINHPDHLAAGDTALDAIFPYARDRLCCPELEAEGLEPYKVQTVLLAMTDQTNFTVDITPTLETKLEALRAHRSQISDPEALAERLREWAAHTARNHDFQYGEAFWRINLDR